ncbi:MAG: hypothetical protein MUP73_05725 [Dehalococcoidia bacterium]|nr:hypothetical protein [Dehalococcoidia bacterium]
MKYTELNEAAQAKAFDTFQSYVDDFEWAESLLGDWIEKLLEVGIITTREGIQWSGFWSQGDGASFTGEIYLRKFLESHPDLRLAHRELYMSTVPIGNEGAACEYCPVITRHRHNYSHENTVHIGECQVEVMWDYELEELEELQTHYHELFTAAEEDIEEKCRYYMRELYSDLSDEYECQTGMAAFLEIAPFQDYNEQGGLE